MQSHSINRRHFLAGVSATGVLAALAACSRDPSPTANAADVTATTAAAGPFSYTDGRGKTVSLKQPPARVVAQSSAAAALWDAGFKVDGAYGELTKTAGKLNYQAGRLDLTGVTVVGSTYGEFNLEKYAAMAPDLLIDLTFDGKTLWYVPASTATKVAAIAPSVGVKMPGLALPAIIEEFMALAAKLGADTGSATVVQAKASYDAAITAVTAAAAKQQNLKVLAVSRTKDSVYIADPKAQPDLAQLAGLGVQFVKPSKTLKSSDYFQLISWEEIDSFVADVVIYDEREPADMAAAAKKITPWTNLPAVKAGQVYAWKPAAPYSYAAYGPLYSEVADWLAGAKKVT